ncbi:MAG: hypothetical protein JO227_12410 [Acetobacteraceae bacterium]|nr:hypothetical protein [Acetobacteraceae bacterium]
MKRSTVRAQMPAQANTRAQADSKFRVLDDNELKVVNGGGRGGFHGSYAATDPHVQD